MEIAISRSPALTVAIALAGGMVCQALARHLRVPGIVLLLAAGVLLGPEVAGVVDPAGLGPALQLIVGMSVAVILFEGGLNLNVARLRREATTLRRLVTVGALVTAVCGTLAARWIMGWGWDLAALFGSLVVVTGPTVMTPLLRRIDVRPNLRTILEGEGILIDPVGAVLAVVTLEFVLTLQGAHGGPVATELLGLPSRLVLGGTVGLVGGAVVGILLRFERLIPTGMENVLALSLVLVLFEVSEALQPESGIMAAATAGIVVGNMGTQVEQELKEFKEQLTVLLIGLLFILLAATVRMEAVAALGWPAVATIAVLMLVVRPVNVAVSTWGTDLTFRERAFMSWLAPRGIVAAAVASLFAQWLSAEGLPGGEELQAMVFLVIAATVVVQGGTGKMVASFLGVRRDTERGWAVVGANSLGRALARALEVAGAEVVVLDSSARQCEAAEREGLRVVYGDAGSDRAMRQADMEYRRGVTGVTPNSALNVLLARQLRERAGLETAGAALDRRDGDVTGGTLEDAAVRPLFGRPLDLYAWRHRLEQGMTDLSAWRAGEGTDAGAGWAGDLPESMLPLVRSRGGIPEPVTDATELAAGDVVYFAWAYEEGESAGRWLRERGWSPVASP